MLEKILKARLEQVIEFKNDAIERRDLLGLRIAELSSEEEYLSKLVQLYRTYNPDPSAISDRETNDIMNKNPQKTKVRISPELLDALDKLEIHKNEKLEKKIRKDIERELREELEPVVKQEIHDEYEEIFNREKQLISDVNNLLNQEKKDFLTFNSENQIAITQNTDTDFDITTQNTNPPSSSKKTSKKVERLNLSSVKNYKKEKIKKEKAENQSQRKNLAGLGPLVNKDGDVDYKLIGSEIEKFIMTKDNTYVTADEISDYLTEFHPYLSSVWKSIRKGVSNVLHRIDSLEKIKEENSRKNLYRVKTSL